MGAYQRTNTVVDAILRQTIETNGLTMVVAIASPPSQFLTLAKLTRSSIAGRCYPFRGFKRCLACNCELLHYSSASNSQLTSVTCLFTPSSPTSRSSSFVRCSFSAVSAMSRELISSVYFQTSTRFWSRVSPSRTPRHSNHFARTDSSSKVNSRQRLTANLHSSENEISRPSIVKSGTSTVNSRKSGLHSRFGAMVRSKSSPPPTPPRPVYVSMEYGIKIQSRIQP